MMPQMPNLVLTAEDLLLAFVLGALIGIERQWRHRARPQYRNQGQRGGTRHQRKST